MSASLPVWPQSRCNSMFAHLSSLLDCDMLEGRACILPLGAHCPGPGMSSLQSGHSLDKHLFNVHHHMSDL